MLQLSKYSSESESCFYSDFRLAFMRMANEVERKNTTSNRDFTTAGRHEVN